ncbi:hypothetical protein OUZ56_012165 [Daphnia magna]|uniref:Uncharacterized protein n=1 Tax=Daphnia magna TaxID=35525 RepID=A0ABQ9Z276_9CRUS|nr:hypothetical protein OUZ56_012165 [Daphnia magna]
MGKATEKFSNFIRKKLLKKLGLWLLILIITIFWQTDVTLVNNWQIFESAQSVRGMEDDQPYGRQMRVYHKVGISRRKRKITTKIEGRFPIGFDY